MSDLCGGVNLLQIEDSDVRFLLMGCGKLF